MTNRGFCNSLEQGIDFWNNTSQIESIDKKLVGWSILFDLIYWQLSNVSFFCPLTTTTTTTTITTTTTTTTTNDDDDDDDIDKRNEKGRRKTTTNISLQN